MSKNIALAFIATAIAVVFGVVAVAVITHTQPVLQGASGQTHSFHEDFPGGISLGGQVLPVTVSTSSPTSTLTAAQVCRNGVLLFDPTASGETTGTITLPAGRTLGECLPYPGSRYTIVVKNLGGNATSVITFLAGTSTTMFSVGASSTATSTLQGAKVANITFIRDVFNQTSSTINVADIEFQQGF